MNALLFDGLPSEVMEVFTQLEQSVASRTELLRLQSEAAAAEPEALRISEKAVADLEIAETDLALATDENFRALTDRVERARAKVELTRSDLETLRRRQRGIAAKMPEADAAVEAAKTKWDQCFFRGELIRRYQQYRAEATAAFVLASRVGWAIEDAWPNTVGSVLREVKIRDFGPQPGRPSPCLIDGATAWLDDDPAGTNLRVIDAGDPMIGALHKLLQPIGRVERAAETAMTRIRDDRARREAQQPYQRPRARSAADIENDRVQKMSPEEYRAHMAAKVNAERLYPAPGRVTFSQGNVRG
jgi:hypothetical protein